MRGLLSRCKIQLSLDTRLAKTSGLVITHRKSPNSTSLSQNELKMVTGLNHLPFLHRRVLAMACFILNNLEQTPSLVELVEFSFCAS